MEDQVERKVDSTEKTEVAQEERTTQEVAAAKPKKSHKKLIKALVGIAVALLVLAVTAFLLFFFLVLRPNSIYNDAQQALEAKDFVECQRLIDRIPNHKGVPSLKQELTLEQARAYIDSGNYDQAELLLLPIIGTPEAKELQNDIIYARACKALARGDIDDVREYLDMIPNHEDPEKLREQLKYDEAMAAVEGGDYETAYELFSELGNYKDAADQKDIVYYEALAFKSLFAIQNTLKNPSSLRVTEVVFYEDSSEDGELDIIVEITATNTYGGALGGYVYDLALYDGEDDSGMLDHSSYVDPDDTWDLLEQMIIDAVKQQNVFPADVDEARMNRLLEEGVTFKVDLEFGSDAVVEN